MKISANRIETILAKRGMTKAALADSCGVSRQNVSTIDLQQFDGLDDTVKRGVYVLLRWVGFLDEDLYGFLMKNANWG